MSKCRHGSEVIRTQRLPHRVSYSLGNEISPPYPESWRGGIFGQVVAEGNERDARLRNSEMQYSGRSYTHGYDNSTQVFGE